MRQSRFAPLIMLALLAGCQSLAVLRTDNEPSKTKLASDDAQLPPELPPALGAISVPNVEVLPEAELKAPLLISAAAQPLSLQDAAALTLAQNPDLIAARQAEGVSLGALGIAETYPFNPSVQVQLTPSPQRQDGTTGPAAHYVLLMQTLQLAHQRQHRQAAAQSVLNGTRWNIVQAELQAVAQTERLFFLALYQSSLRDIFKANANLSRELLTVSEKRLAAGALSKADVAIARLDELAARRRAELGDANYQTALLDLRRQLNLPLELPLALRGDLAEFRFSSVTDVASADQTGEEGLSLADSRQIGYQLAANRPDVLAAQSDFDASRANLNLAHANRIPDLQIGPYYQLTDGGITLWGFRAQSDLPILNNGLPLARQRAAEVTQRRTIWEQLQARAALETEMAIDRYERARRLVAAVGPGFGELPEELAKLEAQVKAGEVDVLRIVAARTSLLQARQAHLDSLNELAQSAAALTAATGLPPESVVAFP